MNTDVQAEILSAATRLFAARGFDGASLQQIATAVGMRKPSLLYHFPSKGALHRAVLERILDHWNEALPRLLKAAASGEERFQAVVSEVIRFFSADPDRARLLIREVLDRPAQMDALVRGYVQPWVTLVSDYIRKGQAQGLIYTDVDPEAYCNYVIHLVVSSVASYESMAGLVPGAPTEVLARHGRELLRIARASLFRSPELAAAWPDSKPGA